MDVARFVVDDPDGLVVDRQHYPQGTVVAFTALGELYHAVKGKLREEDERDQRGQAAVVLDRAPQYLSGHRAGLQ